METKQNPSSVSIKKGLVNKIEAIYSQGTAGETEDGFFVNPPFFGVVDGFSAPYNDKRKPELFDGQRGGEMVRKEVLKAFYSASPHDPLEDVVLEANRKIGEIQTAKGIAIESSERLAGGSFAFCKIEKGKMKIIRGADCYVLWTADSGKANITKPQNYDYETKAHRIIKGLMKKHKGDRQKMWIDFYRPLQRMRRKNSNKGTELGFAVLNGQPWVKYHWEAFELPSGSVKTLLLLTDGFMPFIEYGRQYGIAREMIDLYETEGLSGMLENSRQAERLRIRENYIDYQETSGVAIKFAK